jgi:hypothetical protein
MLELIVGVCGILGNLALVASVLLLLREVRENIRLTRAGNAQSLVELATPFYLALAQDRQMAELYARGRSDFDEMDSVDQSRYRCLLVWWLIFYENIYYQRRHRYLAQDAFQPWWRDLQRLAIDQHLARHWDDIRNLFQDEFAQEITQLLDNSVVTASRTPASRTPASRTPVGK